MAHDVTMKSSVNTLETPEAAAEQAAKDFQGLVHQVLAQKSRFTVALPGGSTPKLFFTRLSQEPYRSQIPWDRVWIFWGDERCVPPDNPQSNYRMARASLLEPLGVRDEQVHRMRGELGAQAAAEDYRAVLERCPGPGTGGLPVFDLILLGMGPDGHTASLFPGDPALHERMRLVVAATVVAEPPRRLTLTYPALARAACIHFLVSGSDKAAVLRDVLSGNANPATYPAAGVQTPHGRIVWWLDRDAASRRRSTRPRTTRAARTSSRARARAARRTCSRRAPRPAAA